MPLKLIEERWAKIKSLSLKEGAHFPDSTFCVMEAVAFVAGEKWSDHPECACPIISTFLRAWNDALPSDEDRDRLLKPLIPKLLNTRNKSLEERRSLMAADWLVRVNTPAWLRLVGLKEQADALAELPEITSMAHVPSIKGPIEVASRYADAVKDAAWDAVKAAASAAAWDTATAVSRDTVRDLVSAAVRAAEAAAAAKIKLAPTIEELQQSAVKLVERMIALK
jgi:hypothetical protein